MADDLDSIVKGAPLPGRETTARSVGGTSPIATSAGAKAGDPLSHTPSSPSMIYLNLLILEASLRAQYLELRARRRHHTFFLTLLTLWTTGFGYALFFAPREDGIGVGGSVYWVVEAAEKLCFMGGVITAVLVWATGIWDRGVRWPRRWFGISNRGLRGFNCKLVVSHRPWWAELLSTMGWFLTYGLFSNNSGSSYRYVDPALLREVDRELNLSALGHPTLPAVGEDEERGGHEEDLAPGGDYVKLLLLAKPFSPTFRENWELYRTEYWERENERRALIGAKLKQRDRQLKKQQRGGWLFWWTPWYRGAAEAVEKPMAATGAAGAGAAGSVRGGDGSSSEKGHLHPRHAVIEREHKRTRSSSVRRGSMSAGTNSRSTTPTIELEEGAGGIGGPGEKTVSRKASTASTASERRKKGGKTPSTGSLRGSTTKRPSTEFRSVTPDIPSPLAKDDGSGGGGGPATPTGAPEDGPGPGTRRLRPARPPLSSMS